MAEYLEREAAVMRLMQDGCSAKNVQSIMEIPAVDVEKISDGYHTFADLYEQRLILSAALAKNNPYAWKSKRHEDGSVPFGGGWFIMGFDTDEGCYTYHYELKDWDLFQCKELDKGKPWDGHTSRDVRRLLSIPAAVSAPQWISVKDGMPENEKQVILLRRNGKVSRAEVRKIGETVRFRLYSEEDDYSPVTHWAAFHAMPLPEPPKGENDG